MYRNISDDAMKNTEGKYKVLICEEDLISIISNRSTHIDAIKERTRISALLGKVRNHPIIKWGENNGSKTHQTIQEIKDYAKENKIYLYENSEMSLEEWIEYIKSFNNKVENVISEATSQEFSIDGRIALNYIIDEYKKAVNEANKLLDSEEESSTTGIKSIKDAIECIKKLYNCICIRTNDLMGLGIDENNKNICNLSHNFMNSILSVQYTIFKTEKTLNKER